MYYPFTPPPLLSPLLLLLLVSVSLVSSQQQPSPDDPPAICLSLRQSKVCPAFHQFYVSTGVVDRYPFLSSNITTVQELDQGLLSFVNSTSDYLLPLGCLGTNYSPNPPYARYALTKMCARLIQDPEDSLPCNTEHNVVPPPLCQSTCLDWVHSVTAITSQPQVCSDTSQRTAALANYTSHCLSWQGYNATADQNCISGFANEPDNCGFRDNVKEACEFCQNKPPSNCCQMVTCPNPDKQQGLSLATIIGIVIGGVAGMSLILVAAFCFRRSKRRRSSRHKDDDDPFPPVASTASSYFSDSKTAIQQPHHPHHLHPFKHWIEDSNTTAAPTTVSLMKNISATSLPSPISLQDDHHLQPPPPPQQQQDLYNVVHAYPPQMEDELALCIGDTILLAYPFDDGWALGVNTATGLKGAFPLICVTRIEPSATTKPESTTLVTSTIPKRMASKSSKSASSPFR